MQVWVAMLCLLNGDVADGYSWEKEASPEIRENEDVSLVILVSERERGPRGRREHWLVPLGV